MLEDLLWAVESEDRARGGCEWRSEEAVQVLKIGPFRDVDPDEFSF